MAERGAWPLHAQALGQEGFLEARNADDKSEQRKVSVSPNRPVSKDACSKEETESRENVSAVEGVEETPNTGGAGSSTDGVVRNALSQEVAAEDAKDEPDEAEEIEEGRTSRGVCAPMRVSKEEREEHERTHLPYRAWCPHCVKGRGRRTAHKKKAEREDSDAVPRIVLDYFFMSDSDQKAHQNPILVMIDESTGDRYARAVGQKGLGREREMDWLIKDMSDELKSWGHSGGAGGRLIMKSDNEKAIVVVRDALAKYHGGRNTPESPAPNESQSNGLVEEAGKTIREIARVLKEQLEDKAEMSIKPDDAIVLWMIRWSAMCLSRFQVGQDGRTAYERRRGRKCQLPVVPFGEKVWYHQAREGKERKDKFVSEVKEGIWLGHTRSSNEAVVGTKDGVVRAHTIKRREADERWDGKMVREIRGTPQQPDPTKAGVAIPLRVNFDPPVDSTPLESRPLRQEKGMRRMMITGKLLEKYGYTEGCEGCKCKRSGMTDVRSDHTEACRARIEAAMEDEDEGKEKRRADRMRLDRKLAEYLEEQEEKKVQDASTDRPPVVQEANDDPADVDQKEEEEVEPENIDENVEKKRSRTEADREEPEEKRARSDAVTSQEDLDGDTEMTLKLYKVAVDLAEMYSPPRITVQGEKLGLRVGEAMDLTNGWDFRKSEHREKARQYRRERKPKLLVGSPMCTMFCLLQNLSPWTQEKQRRWVEAKMHMDFMMEMYTEQVKEGRWFLHEHPASATSWGLQEVMKVMQLKGVEVTIADQCQYGLTTWSKDGRLMPARKRTKFMTNCHEIAEELNRRCDGSHEHQQLISGRAAGAARYPDGLCIAVCKGLMKAMRNKAMNVKPLMSLQAVTSVDKKACDDAHDQEDCGRYAIDDVTGENLDPKEVIRARQKEIEYIENKKVWKKISRAEAEKRGWKTIQTRWIDVNKGDKSNPVYRSRLVGKEFNTGEADGLFAATPPLEALRMIVSDAATIGKGKRAERKVIMVNDVARAFFEAPMRREVCIELPPEAREEGKDEVGFLRMSLYGTRDAAANFQREVRATMVKAGFTVSRYNPTTYYHRGRGLRSFVHGDDFVTSGRLSDVMWLREVLRNRFEIKTTIVGTGEGEVRETKVLNRVIRVEEDGWRYEADQRHGEVIIRTLNMESAKGAATPGEDEKSGKVLEAEVPLTGKEATGYRALAARANYLALDRPDIQYAVKEICRCMSAPARSDLAKLRRLARYLIERPRLVVKYPFQGEHAEISGYSDSDWAGCRRTAKSTSGGVVMRGGHFLKSWSSTQKNITLSSGEAELVAAVKTSVEILGIKQMAEEWGLEVDGSVYVDSSAALGVTRRVGCGKMRHVKVGLLWVQQRAEDGSLAYRKVAGAVNPGDLMTKYLGRKVSESLMEIINLEFDTGRADSSLQL